MEDNKEHDFRYPREAFKCQLPVPGKTFFYRKKTAKDVNYHPSDINNGIIVKFDDEGVTGTKEAIEYLISNPDAWYRMDNIAKVDYEELKKAGEMTRQQRRKAERNHKKVPEITGKNQV